MLQYKVVPITYARWSWVGIFSTVAAMAAGLFAKIAYKESR